MTSVAAGLSTCGKIPFVSTFAMFAAGRSFEQIRNSIGYPHLNVKICATHAGISVGEDGATHQCNEDIALMRTIPGMTIVNPSDAVEAKAVVEAAIKHDGPVYMRFGRLAVETIFDADTFKFEIGKAQTLNDGKDVTIIATGLTTSIAKDAVKLLEAEGISARLINMASIKPIDKDIIVKAAEETGCILTVEEHNVIGGLGSAVAEVVCETVPVPVLRVGVEDTFGKSGPAVQLLHEFGLDAANIVAKCKAAVELKK
jgi:transketolase